MNILLIGAQGSGKGTQAAQLSLVLGVCHISSGDLFRKTLEEKTALSAKVKTYLDRGELVPDEITTAMVLERIAQPDCIPGILLDGFPRTIAQAKILDKGLHDVGQSLDRVMYLEVPRAELLKRLSGRYICRAHQHIYNVLSQPPKISGICDIDGSELYQRADDRGEAVQKRLDIFFNETIRLLDYYDRQQKLVTINGNQDIDKVHFDLLSAINSVVFNTALGSSIGAATKFPSRFYACEQ
jgi:adenylate kinase